MTVWDVVISETKAQLFVKASYLNYFQSFSSLIFQACTTRQSDVDFRFKTGLLNLFSFMTPGQATGTEHISSFLT
jgi:hypothetical protein